MLLRSWMRRLAVKKKAHAATTLFVLGLWIGSIASAGTAGPSNAQPHAEVVTLQYEVVTLNRRIGTAPAQRNISTVLDKTVEYINCL